MPNLFTIENHGPLIRTEKTALTKAGTPRKNKPGAGRPEVGRSVGLPRISPGTRCVLTLVQQGLAHETGRKVSVADALEVAIAMGADVLLGVDPRQRIRTGRR